MKPDVPELETNIAGRSERAVLFYAERMKQWPCGSSQGCCRKSLRPLPSFWLGGDTVPPFDSATLGFWP
jgi:hypothetical protein